MQPSSGNTQPKNNHESRVVRCPNCGHHNPPGQKFCGACGNPLQTQSVPGQSVSPSVAKPRKPSKKKMSPTIIGAIITMVGTVLVALVSSPLVLGLWGGGTKPVTVHVRVADSNGAAIKNATVTLFLPQGAMLKYTGTDGAVTFENVESKEQKNADLIVEADQYQTTSKEIPVTGNQNLELRLPAPDPNSSTIFIRVVDAGSSRPVDGAKVELIVSGNNFVQSTDSNGIAPYKVSFFSSDNVDADLTVNSSNYNINRQRVSLLPNSVQDVRLSKDQAVVGDVTVMQPTSVPGESNPTGTTPISFGQNVTGSIDLPAEIDKYSFSGHANDVILIRIARVSDGNLCFSTELIGPDNKDAGTPGGNCTLNQFNTTLPMDGTYILIVGDRDGPNTGQYALTLEKLR